MSTTFLQSPRFSTCSWWRRGAAGLVLPEFSGAILTHDIARTPSKTTRRSIVQDLASALRECPYRSSLYMAK